MLKKKCKFCGKEFLGGSARAAYCPECWNMEVACTECGKKFKPSKNVMCLYLRTKGRHLTFCSHECYSKSKDVTAKKKATMKQHYGTENFMGTPEGKQKIKDAWAKKSDKEKKEIRERTEATCTKIYGVKCPLQSKEIREKGKKTSLERYGTESPMQSEDIKEVQKSKIQDKHGSEITNNFQVEEYKNKAKRTKEERYGNPNYNNSKQAAKTCRERYGVDNPSQLLDIQMKKKATQLSHGKISSSEQKVIKYLTDLGYKKQQDYFIEYKSDEYPFFCDFYFPKTKLFLELNIHGTHCGCWYNSQNKLCQEKRNKFLSKAKTSAFYKDLVDVWTRRDVKKRNTARKNKLNYVVLWKDKDIDEWFSLGMPNGQDWQKEYTWKRN